MNISDIKRKFYLKFSDINFIINMFRYCGCGFIVIVVALLAFLLHDFLLIIFALPFVIIFGFVVPFFIRMVVKGMTKNVVLPQVNDIKTEKEKLFEIVEKLNEDKNLPWQFEVHKQESWIDVTWKWKDYASLETGGIKKNRKVFYKFYKIHDNFTYEELDMNTSLMFGVGGSGFGLSYNMQVGHQQYMAFSIPFVSYDSNNGTQILKERSINTLELTNYMHKFFAENGYTFKKWY